jgi:glycosyltransferase involved in cell wall biosynthesis
MASPGEVCMADEPSHGAVCIVRHGYYPSELNVRREAEALRGRGFEVHVICLRGPGEPRCETVDGVTVRRMPLTHRRRGILRYLLEYHLFLVLAAWALLRVRRRAALRAVQVNTMPDHLVFATVPLRLFGTKVVLHVHEPMPELFATLFPRRHHRPLVALVELAQRASLAYADHALTVTSAMRESLARRGIPREKVTVIVNAPDERLVAMGRRPEIVARANQMRRERGASGTQRIVCHGTIERRYGIDLVVRAVARLVGDFPGLQFRLMGSGDHVDEVLSLADRLGVAAHVAYLGFVPLDTMVAELLAADLTVVPMRRNAYSELVHTNKMFEYIAFERPVIASRLEAVAAYFPPDSLLYFEPDNDADLAERVRYGLTHADEMEQRVRRSTEIFAQYRWAVERPRYLDVYERLLGMGPTS